MASSSAWWSSAVNACTTSMYEISWFGGRRSRCKTYRTSTTRDGCQRGLSCQQYRQTTRQPSNSLNNRLPALWILKPPEFGNFTPFVVGRLLFIEIVLFPSAKKPCRMWEIYAHLLPTPAYYIESNVFTSGKLCFLWYRCHTKDCSLNMCMRERNGLSRHFTKGISCFAVILTVLAVILTVRV